MNRLFAMTLLVVGLFVHPAPVLAQGPPSPGGEGMDWQLGAIFTAHWVVVAIAIAMLSRPSKRSEKPKKPEGEISS